MIISDIIPEKIGNHFIDEVRWLDGQCLFMSFLAESDQKLIDEGKAQEGDYYNIWCECETCPDWDISTHYQTFNDTELAYKLGGVEINLDNYINDGVWNAGLWWEDFDKWWNSLPVEEQKRIHYKLFNADAYPQFAFGDNWYDKDGEFIDSPDEKYLTDEEKEQIIDLMTKIVNESK